MQSKSFPAFSFVASSLSHRVRITKQSLSACCDNAANLKLLRKLEVAPLIVTSRFLPGSSIPLAARFPLLTTVLSHQFGLHSALGIEYR
jgi:hypothetical protein